MIIWHMTFLYAISMHWNLMWLHSTWYLIIWQERNKVKINFTFSSYEDLFQGTPHRSILERILFNLFLCDLYLFVDELILRSYAVDNTPSVCSENVSVILEKLGDVRNLFFEWFSSTCYRQMVANAIPS